MQPTNLKAAVNFNNNIEVGESMYDLILELYPICRSITGDGVRQTLNVVKQYIPLDINEAPTGTQVFDWTVPKEWEIRDAYIKNSKGDRIIDFRKSNLHVLNYSRPIRGKMPLHELQSHLYTIPEYPERIPYRTSYYSENWGFCLSHNQFLELNNEEEYEVCIDSTLKDGALTYGECYIKGTTHEEVLISCHCCHPSLCNDNLSGLVLVTFLAKYLNQLSLKYSYRLLFIPGTIGSITWLALNENVIPRIQHGLVVACVGDPGRFTYKKSRDGNAAIDDSVIHVLQHSRKEFEVCDFSPYGYDERQYCSPAFNLPVGCLMRTPHGCFPEYHTSADNLDFVRPYALGESFETYLSVIDILENNKRFINLNPKCEPQLGKRGLYKAIGGGGEEGNLELAMLWVLNLSDGQYTLLEIAKRSGLKFGVIKKVADILYAHKLLEECSV